MTFCATPAAADTLSTYSPSSGKVCRYGAAARAERQVFADPVLLIEERETL